MQAASHVFGTAPKSSLNITVLIWTVGVSKLLFDENLFANISKLPTKELAPLLDIIIISTFD